MADKTTTLAGEASVAALAERLVKDGTVAKPADMAAFQKQLVAVNPHLADIAKLPPGTPVVVPKAPVLPPTPAEADPRVHDAMEQLRTLLAAGRAILADAAEAEKAKAAAATSDEVKKAVADVGARDAKLAQSLSSAVGAVKLDPTKIDAATKARATVLTGVAARLGVAKPS